MAIPMYVVALTTTFAFFASAQNSQYCNLSSCSGKTHTLCKYPFLKPSGNCGKVEKSSLTKDEIQELLTTHNNYRRLVASGGERRGSPGPQPSAKSMPALQWSDEIAGIAQTWADQCDFKHDECRNTAQYAVGQNIGYVGSTGSNQAKLSQIVTSWYNEVAKFDRRQVSKYAFSHDTGHYTQMVWAKTTHLGCGAIRYNNDGKWNKLYLVCNYGPTGNWIGQPIYEAR